MVRKLKNSLSLKTFTLILVMLIASCSLIYGMVMFYVPRTYQYQVSEQFNIDLDELIQKIDVENIERSIPFIQEFCTLNKTGVTILNNYDVIYEWAYENIDISEMGNDSSASVAKTYEKNGQVYTISTYTTIESVNQVTVSLLRLLPYIATLILVVSVFLSWICARYISKPMIEISAISKQMSKMNLNWQCKTNRSDEIGVLAVSLNQLAGNLGATMDKLNNANELLRQDIEKEKKREQQRKDFFAAVSHELKTPITLLKCALEGMINKIGIYKDRDKYLTNSLVVTQSMESLVAEILMVSKIEEEGYHLELQETNVGALINSCCMFHEELAVNKGIIMDTKIAEDIFSLVDASLMKKAISNVICNAILHSERNEKVIVRLIKKDKQGILSVENTGAHIRDEDMAQIFMPFYRVEKSRNRHSGGSGLGLHIVKTILTMHQCDYSLVNTEKGICFTISFQII